MKIGEEKEFPCNEYNRNIEIYLVFDQKNESFIGVSLL